jgi:hypothetical protein
VAVSVSVKCLITMHQLLQSVAGPALIMDKSILKILNLQINRQPRKVEGAVRIAKVACGAFHNLLLTWWVRARCLLGIDVSSGCIEGHRAWIEVLLQQTRPATGMPSEHRKVHVLPAGMARCMLGASTTLVRCASARCLPACAVSQCRSHCVR